jgi:hypothetical protein
MRRSLIHLIARTRPSLLLPQFRSEKRDGQRPLDRGIRLSGKRNGFFVEAGAANGRNGSSCYVLERRLGWKGIARESALHRKGARWPWTLRQ